MLRAKEILSAALELEPHERERMEAPEAPSQVDS
jgi:hypothetical protein